MNQTMIMKCAAVVAALFGLILLFAPNALMAMYKAEMLNAAGIYNSMLSGTYLIALAVMNWTASTSPAGQARHVILGTFVAMALGFAVALIRQLTPGAAPAMGWLNVVIFLVFTGLYGYLRFGQRVAESAAPSAA